MSTNSNLFSEPLIDEVYTHLVDITSDNEPFTYEIPKHDRLYTFLTSLPNIFQPFKDLIRSEFYSEVTIDQDSIKIYGNKFILFSKLWDESKWSNDLKNSIENYFYTFSFEKKNLSNSIWEKIIELVRKIDTEAILSLDSITLIGSKSTIENLRHLIESKLNELSNYHEETISLTKIKYEILVLENFNSFGVTIDLNESRIILTGTFEQVSNLASSLQNLVNSIKTSNYKLDKHVVEYLENKREFVQNNLNDKNLKCYYQKLPGAHELGFFSISSINQESLNKCFEYFRDQFKSLPYQNSNYIDQNKLKEFIQEEIQLFNDYLIVTLTNESVITSGKSECVDCFVNCLNDFVKLNSITVETLNFMKEDIEYFERVCYDKIERLTIECNEALNLTDSLQFDQGIVRIKSNYLYQSKFTELLNELLSKRIREEFNLDDIELVGVLKDQKYVDQILKLEKTFKCLLKVKEETQEKVTIFCRNVPKLVKIDSTTEKNKYSKIVIQYGSLIDESLIVDVVVNSTSPKLEINTGIVSSQIYNQTGQEVLDELKQKYPNGIYLRQVAVSSSGKMKNKKFIFHVTLTKWDVNTSKNLLSDTIRSVLTTAESYNVTSIAFPTLGAGALNYPKHEIPRLLYDPIDEYFKSNPGSKIQQVYLIVFEQDIECVEEFKKFETSFDHKPSKKVFVSSDESKEISFELKNIKIRIYCGDICDSITDVILNPTNSNLSLNGAVSKALNKVDTNFSKNLKPNFPLCPAGGDLKCKFILSVDVESQIDYILQALNNPAGFESITIPLIGAGNSGRDPKECCEHLLESIVKYTTYGNTLKQIDVCIFYSQSSYLDLFQVVLEKKFNTSATNSSVTTTKKTSNQILSYTIVSDERDKIESVKTEIKRIASDQIHTENFNERNCIQFTDIDKQNIEIYCHGNYVKVVWDRCDITQLVGQLPKIMTCYKYIQSLINAKYFSIHHQWKYFKNEVWVDFNVFLNKELEIGYQKMVKNKIENKVVFNDEDDCETIADLENMVKYEKLNPSVNVKIKRFEAHDSNSIQLPDNWDHGKELNLIDLQQNSNEYITVLNEFISAGLKIKNVFSIQRVQNKALYMQYVILKQQMEKKYPNFDLQKRVFHGTMNECVDNIWQSGFNRSYAGKNATAYGQGVYFAKNASYSHNYTSLRCGSIQGRMFLSRIIVGTICVGSKWMKVPPFDAETTVDDLNFPSIYVIYKDAQAYPEYILTYQ